MEYRQTDRQTHVRHTCKHTDIERNITDRHIQTCRDYAKHMTTHVDHKYIFIVCMREREREGQTGQIKITHFIVGGAKPRLTI